MDPRRVRDLPALSVHAHAFADAAVAGCHRRRDHVARVAREQRARTRAAARPLTRRLRVERAVDQASRALEEREAELVERKLGATHPQRLETSAELVA